MSINMCGTAQTATSRSDRCRVPGTPVRQRTDGAHRTDYNRGFSLMHRKYNMQQHHNIPHARHALTSLTLAVLGALRRNQGPPRDHRPDRPGKDIGHWQGRIGPGHQAGGLQGRAPDRRPGHLPAAGPACRDRSGQRPPGDRGLGRDDAGTSAADRHGCRCAAGDAVLGPVAGPSERLRAGAGAVGLPPWPGRCDPDRQAATRTRTEAGRAPVGERPTRYGRRGRARRTRSCSTCCTSPDRNTGLTAQRHGRLPASAAPTSAEPNSSLHG